MNFFLFFSSQKPHFCPKSHISNQMSLSQTHFLYKPHYRFTSPTYIFLPILSFLPFHLLADTQKVPFRQGTHFPEKHHFDLPISNKMFLSQTVFPRSHMLAQNLYFYPKIPFGHPLFLNLRANLVLNPLLLLKSPPSTLISLKSPIFA